MEVKVNSPHVGRNMKMNYFIPTFLIAPQNVVPNSDPACYYSDGAFLPDVRDPNSNTRNVEHSGLLLNQGTPDQPFYLSFLVAEAPLKPKSSRYIQIQDVDPTKIAQTQLNLLEDDDDLDSTF